MRNYEDVVKELDSKIPRSAIATRDGGNGVKLDYLSNYYVKTRLNEVLGQGNWEYRVIKRELTYSGPVKRYNGDVHSASYIVDVEFTAKIGTSTVRFVDTGYGDGTDKTNPGKAHELAAKEAATDALKRCAANLGQSMGLALYEKEQTNVAEENEDSFEKHELRADGASVPSVSAEPGPRRIDRNSISSGEVPKAVGSNLPKDIKAIRSSVKSAARILDSKGTLKIEQFKAKYSVNKVDDLSDDDTLKLYAKVKTDYPHIFKGETSGQTKQ